MQGQLIRDSPTLEQLTRVRATQGLGKRATALTMMETDALTTTSMEACSPKHVSSPSESAPASCPTAEMAVSARVTTDPNYQTLEDRCDGIDNDCDGRIDHSWTRVLFSADAGAAGGCTDPSTGRPRVCFVDAFGAQVWVEPEGLLYTNGSRFTRLTRTLAISSDSLDLFAGPARMFRNGNNWLRFVFINGWTGAPPHDHSVALHEVANDGGFKRATDGGVAFIATFFPPASFGIPVTPPLSPSDGGFNTMGILLSETGSNESVAFIAHFDRDGGLSVRTRPLDAGFGTLPISAPYGSGFAVTPGVASTSPVDELSLCDESLTCSTAIAATSSGLSNCTFAGVPNERLVCRGYPSGKPVTWRTLDGGNLFSSDGEVSPLDDKLLGATVSDRLFVLMSFPDGGHQYGTLDSTGAHAFMKSPELVGTWAAVQFHQLDGGLHLVVWGDAQTGLSANSEYDQVNAEFVCVP